MTSSTTRSTFNDLGAYEYNSVGSPSSPTLTIQSATSVGTSSATLNGTITSVGGVDAITEGFNYGLTTAYGSVASANGTFGTGTFNQTISGLSPSTTYHFQTFATNVSGTGTSTDGTFTTNALGAPIISGISVSPSQTSAVVSWTTDQAASSTVNYGLTTSYGSIVTSNTLVTSHSITLSALTAGTTYHVQVGGANSVGITSVSTDQIFTTTAASTAPTTSTTTAPVATWTAGGGYPVSVPAIPTVPTGPVCTGGALFNTQTGARCAAAPTPTPEVSTPSPVNPMDLPVPSFSTNLITGNSGIEVKSLQEYLNDHGFTIAKSGPGSLGNETDYFGALTKAALMKFQKAAGITPDSGYFGPITRAYIATHG